MIPIVWIKTTNAYLESDIGHLGFEQDPEKIFQTVMDVTVPLMKQYADSIIGLFNLFNLDSLDAKPSFPEPILDNT